MMQPSEPEAAVTEKCEGCGLNERFCGDPDYCCPACRALPYVTPSEHPNAQPSTESAAPPVIPPVTDTQYEALMDLAKFVETEIDRSPEDESEMREAIKVVRELAAGSAVSEEYWDDGD